ncbi:substrate-binding domain-containing protein [Desulfovibrio inopinatus]|uniref:substrate-binding domain-containing protein n=1 Tax=Desulfovibrio inopinatus TaxID=102109 RepID=UPI0004180A8F|nr:substrate-binding domain-containing protein [Desulfovibrio inopinatus]
MKITRLMLCAFALSLALVGTAFAADTLMMATTTSTDNTGLLDVLAPEFQKDTGIELKWTAVGTGKALKMGENCDVDVLLVHAPAAEKKFVDAGFGKDRREIMYNDFVIIGPAADPAGVKGKSVTDALKTIEAKKAPFVSRGDNSGTNKKEISLWKASGMNVPDKAPWYVQTGQGMLSTINVAAEKNGYTMTDRGTFIKYADSKKGNPPLVVLVEGDKNLFNQYSVIPIDPKHCAKAKNDLAMKFSDWLASKKTQKMIADFQLMGKPLFTPNAK